MTPSQSLAEFLGSDNLPAAAAEPEPCEMSVKDFCRGVLASREYRLSVLNRITLGTLPSAVECKMYDYAYGKPTEHIEHSGRVDSVTEVRRVVVHVSAERIEAAADPSYITH